MSPSRTTRIASGTVLAILTIAGVLVLVTDLRVEDLGPVLVYGVAAVAVGALLLAPVSSARKP